MKNKNVVSLILLYAIVFIFFTCTALYSPIISILINNMGYSISTIGFVQTIGNIAPLICSIPVGIIMKQKGLKVPLAFILLLTAFVSLLLFFITNLINIILILSIIKVAELFITVGLQSYIADVSQEKDLGGKYAWFMIVAQLGGLLGPIIGGGISDHFGQNKTWFIISLLLVISVLLVTAIKNTGIDIEKKEKYSITDFQKIINFPLLIAIFAGASVLFAHGARYNFLSIFLNDYQFSMVAIGSVLSMRSFASISGGFLVVFLKKVFKSDITILIVSISLLGVSLILIPICTNLLTQYINSIFIGIAMGIAVPMSNTMIALVVDKENLPLAISLSQLINRAGQLLSPLLFGVIGNYFSVSMAFVVSGVILIIISVILLISGKKLSYRVISS